MGGGAVSHGGGAGGKGDAEGRLGAGADGVVSVSRMYPGGGDPKIEQPVPSAAMVNGLEVAGAGDEEKGGTRTITERIGGLREHISKQVAWYLHTLLPLQPYRSLSEMSKLSTCSILCFPQFLFPS